MESLGGYTAILVLLRPLVYFMTTWYILWQFSIYFPILVFLTKKYLASLLTNRAEEKQIHV
jgi:hypothetical protein